MILLKNKDKKANIKIGNNIEIKDGNDFPFDLTLYGKSTQATTTGKNLLNLEEFKTQTTNGITATKNNDGTITLNGTSTEAIFLNLNGNKSLIPITQGDIISIGVNNILPTSPTGMYVELRQYGATGNSFVISKGQSAKVNQIANYTDNCFMFIYIPSGMTLNNFVIFPMVVKASSLGDYEPYTGGIPSPNPDYPSPIESITEISATVTGKNLFDGTGWRLVQSGNGFPQPSTGATIISSDKNNISFTSTQWAYAGVESGFIKVKANETYTFSASFTTPTNRFFITQYNESKVRLSTLNSIVNPLQNTTFTTTNDGYIAIAFTNTTTAQTTYKIENIKLEKGTVATDYEEYKSNSLTIDLQGNELCSLPNGTKDEVNITNGEASIVKRTKEFILDENKTIVLEKALTNTTRFLIYNVTSSMNDYPSAISTHFKYLVDYNSDTEHFYITRNGAMYLFVNKSIASTVDELKTWLSKNNVKFLYELAEPETINLGTVEMPHTYEGVSNITNSADTEMVVKYYKKFEFDKILRGGYNIDEQEYEIAKKQMANGKRKKILSSYVDCVIKIDLGLLDNKTYQEYKEQLEDGEYEYWSYKYNQYKKANFILTKPSITTEYAYDDDIGIDDMEITLEKSSDVS